MAVALEQFVKQLSDSGVIAPGRLEKFVPPQAQPKDADELARQLVQSEQLTKYQVQEIYLGRPTSLILGNYTILDKIGAGGMGQVFKAQHRRMERAVAIKMLPTATMNNPAAIARFQREVKAAAKLEHPNIVTAYDADQANGVHFLVMQFVDGEDLSVLVKKNGPFPIDKAVGYTLQAARGLEFAHGEGVVHRDIKPANLLLDKNGTVKILDMGLARIDVCEETDTQATELTGAGAVLGTVDYMAPEQALDTRHADARADIYSLGCSLHYLVTGKAAYDGDSIMAKLLSHREKPIPSLGAEVPEQVQAVFRKMVAKKAEDRYQSMSEVVAELQGCVAAASATRKTPTASESSSNSNRSSVAEATAHSPHHNSTKQAKRPEETAKASKNPDGRIRKRKLLIGGGLLGALFLSAAAIFTMQTKDGTLVVEVNEPDATVQVLTDAGKVEVTRPGENGTISLSVDPGRHRLRVEKNGFAVFGQDFAIESGGKQSITAKLIPLAIKPTAAATKKSLAFETADFVQWEREASALPAENQVAAVVKKLQQLNPAFGGKEMHKIERGEVKQLKLYTANVTDISPVRALRQLRRLDLSSDSSAKSGLSDLSPLQGMPLTELNCIKTPVADLSPLKGMLLTELACDDTRVSDLSPIQGMPLGRVLCSGTSVSDLSPLRGAPLTDLNCGWTQVKDLSPLQGMPLTQLRCRTTQVSDLSPLKGMPLSQLDCANSHIVGLSPLKGMKLTTLAIDNTQVSDLSLLQGMPLTQLSFDNTRVSDLTPLKGMKLTNLSFCQTSASDLSPLAGMPLTELVFAGAPVSDLSPLRGMPLSRLWIGGTKVADLLPLKGMPLTLLFCDGAPVSDLSPLDEMNLSELYVTPKNIIKGFDIIRRMKSLTTIGTGWRNKWPPAEFWKKYDAGELGK